jgi:hypothetical protein
MQGEMRAVQHSGAGLNDGSAELPVTHEHAGHEHGSAASETDEHSEAHDKCSVCSVFCSVTPLASGLPSVLAPPAHAAGLFPDLSAPHPSFLSRTGRSHPPEPCDPLRPRREA